MTFLASAHSYSAQTYEEAKFKIARRGGFATVKPTDSNILTGVITFSLPSPPTTYQSLKTITVEFSSQGARVDTLDLFFAQKRMYSDSTLQQGNTFLHEVSAKVIHNGKGIALEVGVIFDSIFSGIDIQSVSLGFESTGSNLPSVNPAGCSSVFMMGVALDSALRRLEQPQLEELDTSLKEARHTLLDLKSQSPFNSWRATTAILNKVLADLRLPNLVPTSTPLALHAAEVYQDSSRPEDERVIACLNWRRSLVENGVYDNALILETLVGLLEYRGHLGDDMLD